MIWTRLTILPPKELLCMIEPQYVTCVIEPKQVTCQWNYWHILYIFRPSSFGVPSNMIMMQTCMATAKSILKQCHHGTDYFHWMVVGGGFFLACKDSGERFEDSFPFFSFKVEISSHSPVPLLRSGSVQSG